MNQRLRFGEVLIKSGKIDEDQLRSALGHQRRWGRKIGECMVQLGFITEEELAQTLASVLKIPHISLGRIDPSSITRELLNYVPLNVARAERIAPLAIREVNHKRRLVVTTSDPTNYRVFDDIQFKMGLPLLVMVSTDSEIEWFIRRFYMGEVNALSENYVSVAKVKKETEEAPEFVLDNISSIFYDSEFTGVSKVYKDKDKKK